MPPLRRWFEGFDLRGKGLRYYLLFLGLLSFVFLFSLPIVAVDSDLWFHLNGGRYLFMQREIAHASYYSFISPERIWANHFWLFQALVYAIYHAVGYYGLIVFRAAVILATAWLIFRYVLRAVQQKGVSLWSCLVVMLCWMGLLTRSAPIRPHLLDYLFTMCFLYILERHPRKSFVLPLLAVLWSNLHGIAYPLIWLLAGAYISEYFVVRFKNASRDRQLERTFLIPAFLAMCGVLLTPYGTTLLAAPLTSFEFSSLVIHEVRGIPLERLFSIQMVMFRPDLWTVFSVVFWISCVSAATSVLRRRVRVSHLLLWVGGLFVLTKGERFAIEFTLLSLPIMVANPLVNAGRLRRQLTKPLTVIAMALLIVCPVRFIGGLHEVWGKAHRFPLSLDHLPVGVAAFVNRVSKGGTVLNHPDHGGYLGWTLYPNHKIFIDWQAPFLITDADVYVGLRWPVDESVFRQLLARYDPSFIAVPRVYRSFTSIIEKFPQYSAVFFDDEEALYVDNRRYPLIAQTYALKGLDPFDTAQNLRLVQKTDQRDEVLGVVRELLAVYPESRALNQLAGLGYHQQGEFGKAIVHAETMMRNFPGSPDGYSLLGRSLQSMGAYDKALRAYREVLQRVDAGRRYHVYRSIGTVYLAQQKHEDAYQAFRKSFQESAGSGWLQLTTEDLYQLAHVALLTDRKRQAQAMLGIIDEYALGPQLMK